jgi:hypothetical protein
MTDDKNTRTGPAGFTHGMLSEYVEQTEQIVEEWFEEENFKKYREAYLKLATSGTTAAVDALSNQQKGKTSKGSDPVDITRFLADTWLGTMKYAWDATRDLSQLWQNDFSRNLGGDAQSAKASSGQDDKPPPVQADTGTEDRKDEPKKPKKQQG